MHKSISLLSYICTLYKASRVLSRWNTYTVGVVQFTVSLKLNLFHRWGSDPPSDLTGVEVEVEVEVQVSVHCEL